MTPSSLSALLDELPGSLGAPLDHADQSSGDLGAWLARAAGRPAFQLWGKAHPGQAWPAHPLLCHMLDVAAVAARLLTRVLPAPLVTRLLVLHPDPACALRHLLLVIALHDLGKATPAFQSKVDPIFAALRPLGFDASPESNDRHHGDAGLLPVSDALGAVGFSPEVALQLSRAVTAHHGQFPTNLNIRPAGQRQMGKLPRWAEARRQIVREMEDLFFSGLTERGPVGTAPLEHAHVLLLAGLTSVADWLGSMSEVFRYEAPPTSLCAYWSLALTRADLALARAGLLPRAEREYRGFSALFPELSPWPLHETSEAIASSLSGPSLMIVEAPMGEGKTEAALFVADASAARGDTQGLYIGLPTQATANQMFGRVRAFLAKSYPGERLNLLLAHGEASLVEQFEKLRLAAVYDPPTGLRPGSSREGAVRAEGWFLSRKRALLADHAVGTIDQALLSVLRVPHNFVRLYGLAGKTVILDEVHAYDTYTGTLLDRLLEWLAAVGASVVLLSATLPRHRREAFLRAYARGRGADSGAPPAVAYPRITSVSAGHPGARTFQPRGKQVSVQLSWNSPEVEAIVEQALDAIQEGGCVGCIFNTVSRAQQAFDLVRTRRPDIEHRLQLHARLLPDARNAREQLLESWLGPERRTKARPGRAIVIGTQVLEQSLDIDFDLLFTDIAPVDLVLQRAGRLFRHDRSNRSGHHPRPRLVVARPAPGQESDLDDLAAIYPELLVRRTLEILDGREEIVLPADIEPLVEAVYDQTQIPEPGDPLFDAYLAHQGATRADANLAAQKEIPGPTTEDDIFGDLRVFLDEDDDPALHQQLRASTRLGRPSIELVCLGQTPEGLVTLADRLPIDLGVEPDRSTTSRLVRSSIGVSRPSVVRALTAQQAPKSWQGSALLRYRRPVVFEGARATVGGVQLCLDPDLGLVFS